MSPFGELQKLRDRPIGDQVSARERRKGFRSRVPIIRDNQLFGEEVVEARAAGLKGENFYAGDRNPPYWQKVDGATDNSIRAVATARAKSAARSMAAISRAAVLACILCRRCASKGSRRWWWRGVVDV